MPFNAFSPKFYLDSTFFFFAAISSEATLNEASFFNTEFLLSIKIERVFGFLEAFFVSLCFVLLFVLLVCVVDVGFVLTVHIMLSIITYSKY